MSDTSSSSSSPSSTTSVNSQPKRRQRRKRVAKKSDTSKNQPVSWWSISLPNPGKFEEINKESKGILEPRENFDGFRLDFTRAVTKDFSLCHLINFGSSVEPPSYGFISSYVTKGILLNARLFTSSGSVQGKMQFPIFTSGIPRIIGRIIARASKVPGQSQATFEADIKGADYTLQLKHSNGESTEVSYLQSITKSWSAGILTFYDKMMGRAEWTAGLRYAYDCCFYTATLASFGHFTASYTQKSSDNRKFWATEFQMIKPEGQSSWEAVYAAGYQYNFLQSIVKGRVDSNWRCSLFIEERINPLISVLASAEMDYIKDSYKVGVGLSLTI